MENYQLHSKIMESCCSDEWLALTYSEYLNSCAQTTIDLIDEINSNITDDSLSDVIDQLSDDMVSNFAELKANMISFKPDVYNSISYDSGNIDFTSEYDFESFCDLMRNENNAKWIAFKADYDLPDLTEYSGSDEIEKFANYMKRHNYDDFISEQDGYKTVRDNLISTSLDNLKLSPNSYISLSEGNVQLGPLLKKVLDLSALNTTQVDMTFPSVSFQDTALSNITLSLDDFWNQTKSSLGSTLAWAEGFYQAGKENVTDAVVQFKERLSNTFSESSSFINESINTVKMTLIQAKGNVKNFIQLADNMIGFSKITDSIQSIDETNIYSYTGASPWTGINLHSAKGLAEVAVSSIIAIGVGVFNAVKSIGSKLWSKIKPFVTSLSNNPMDIGVIDKDADSYTIDNWAFSTSRKNYPSRKSSVNLSYSDATNKNNAYLALVGSINKTLAYQTIFGETIFTIDNVVKQDSGIRIDYTAQFKPRGIDLVSVGNAGLLRLVSGKILPNPTLSSVSPYLPVQSDTIDDWVDKLNVLKQTAYRVDDAETEKVIYSSFSTANMLALAISNLAGAEIVNEALTANAATGSDLLPTHFTYDYQATGISTRTGDFMNNIFFNSYDPLLANTSLISVSGDLWSYNDKNGGNFSNLDFIHQACGFKDSPLSDTRFGTFYFYDNDAVTPSGDYNIEDIIAPLVYIYAVQRIDKYYDSSSFLYIPYSSDNYTFLDSRYKVKTDAENQNVAAIFTNVIVAVAVIAVAVIIGATVIKAFKRSKYIKLQKRKGRMDNAMWNGSESVDLNLGAGTSNIKVNSNKFTRRYMRYESKLNKMSNAASGLAVGPTVSEQMSIMSNAVSTFVGNNSKPTDNDLYINSLCKSITGKPYIYSTE